MSPATGAVFLLAGAAMALMLLAAILDKPYRSWARWVSGLGELLRFLHQQTENPEALWSGDKSISSRD